VERKVKTVKLGDMVRYRVIITDVESIGIDKVKRRVEFLLDIIGNGFFTGILNCGPLPFDTLRVFHDGTAWVAELEAQENPEVSNG
jgi:hypothetical protein